MNEGFARGLRVSALAATMAGLFLGSVGTAYAAGPDVTRAVSSAPSLRPTAYVESYAPAFSSRPSRRSPANVRSVKMPDLRWDHVDGSDRWTRAAMRALDAHGARLVKTVPRDIAEWCPAYPQADDWERKAFWAGLLSALAKHESTWRPTAVGGDGLWYGLVQILPATARGYGCEAETGAELKNGALNMACAVRIMNVTVPRDDVVARGMRGVAADWGPFHSDRKREDMRRWLTRQPFCNGLQASMRPVERPDPTTTMAREADEVPLFVSWELDKAFPRSVPARDAMDG